MTSSQPDPTHFPALVKACEVLNDKSLTTEIEKLAAQDQQFDWSIPFKQASMEMQASIKREVDRRQIIRKRRPTKVYAAATLALMIATVLIGLFLRNNFIVDGDIITNGLGGLLSLLFAGGIGASFLSFMMTMAVLEDNHNLGKASEDPQIELIVPPAIKYELRTETSRITGKLEAILTRTVPVVDIAAAAKINYKDVRYNPNWKPNYGFISKSEPVLTVPLKSSGSAAINEFERIIKISEALEDEAIKKYNTHLQEYKLKGWLQKAVKLSTLEHQAKDVEEKVAINATIEQELNALAKERGKQRDEERERTATS